MRRGTIHWQSKKAIVFWAHCLLLQSLTLSIGLWVALEPTRTRAEEELAEELAIDAVWDEPSADEIEWDNSFVPTSYDGVASCNNCQPTCLQDCQACPRPSNWLLGPYFKSGVNFVLGKGLLADSQETGYSIVGGVRQPIGRGLGSTNAFIDFGGSYLSAFGTLTREVVGEEFSPSLVPGNPPTPVGPVDVNATLDEVRRAGVHCGWGCYWGPSLDDRCSDPQLRFTTTVGGRLSHVRGSFVETPVAAIPPQNFFTTSITKTDTAGGLYWNTQAILLRRSSALGDMQWTLDGEFAHDWVDFSRFEKRGLGTASVLFGFLLTR